MKKLLNISLSNVCPAALARAAGTFEDVPLMRVYGEARAVQVARNGQSTIMGDFRAINSETGEEFSSSVVYLPRGLNEVVIMGLDDNASLVRFGYDIWAEPEPKGKSYNIGFTDLTEKEGAPDPLSNFASTLPPMAGAAKKK